MNATKALKRCSVCDADVSDDARLKNEAGDYLCPACYAGQGKPTGFRPSPENQRQCIGCEQWFARESCHRNRYGEYVCQTCRKAGVRWSWSKRARRLGRRVMILLIYLAVGSAGLWVFYKLLARLARSMVDAE